MVIILTYEKVLETFGDYLSEDDSCEILQSSRGYLVVDWDSCKDNWVTARLCNTPALLCDTLRSHYEEYQGYRLTDGYKRDVTDQEEQEIARMGAALAARCKEDNT